MRAWSQDLETILEEDAPLTLVRAEQKAPPNLDEILGKGRVKRFLGKYLLAPTHKPLRRMYEERGTPYTWEELKRSPKHIAYFIPAGYLLGELPGDIQKPITEYLGLPENALTMANMPWAAVGTAESAAWIYGAYRLWEGAGGIGSLLGTAALSAIGLYKAGSNILFNPPRFVRSYKNNEAIGATGGIVGLALTPYYATKFALHKMRAYKSRISE